MKLVDIVREEPKEVEDEPTVEDESIFSDEDFYEALSLLEACKNVLKAIVRRYGDEIDPSRIVQADRLRDEVCQFLDCFDCSMEDEES